MLMSKNKIAQIGMGAMISIASMYLIALVGGWFANNNITDAKLNDLRLEQQGKIETLDNNISTININIALICQKFNVKCKDPK